MSVPSSRRVQGPPPHLDPADIVSQGSMFGFRQVVDAPESGTVNIPGQLSFDDIGKVRATDPHTSELAAVAQIGRKKATHRRVLEALYQAGDAGLNDFELGAVLGMAQTSVGVRRGELRDAGLVMKASREDGSVLTRPSPSGSPSICWTLTATGIIHTETRP